MVVTKFHVLHFVSWHGTDVSAAWEHVSAVWEGSHGGRGEEGAWEEPQQEKGVMSALRASASETRSSVGVGGASVQRMSCVKRHVSGGCSAEWKWLNQWCLGGASVRRRKEVSAAREHVRGAVWVGLHC